MTKKRLLYLDVMKGILIVLVVLGHAIQFSTNDYQHVFLFRFIYSFHMPLFFMISGYLTFKREYDKNLIFKRAVQLLVPFVSWAFLLPILKEGAFNLETSKKILLYPDNGLWFLYNLFIYCVLINISELLSTKKMRQEYLFVAFIIMCYGAMFVFNTRFNCSQICWYFPFFAMGYYLRKYENRVLVNKKLFFCLLGGYCIMMPFWMMRESPLFYKWIDLGTVFAYIYRYIVQILGASFFFILGKKLLNKRFYLIDDLGKTTLGIYAFQFPILFYLDKFLEVDNTVGKIAIETLCGICLCYLIVRIIHSIKYLRLFFIGEL